jgi:amino acid adenylation domain-containing protein
MSVETITSLTLNLSKGAPARDVARHLSNCLNGPVIEFPSHKSVDELIEEQVQRTPEAIAVICGNERLSYRELNERADGVAAELQRFGMRADVPVGLCVNRSIEMMIGLLGILKSGACYLPLDPKYPGERIGFMLEDAKPPVVLTEKAISENLELSQSKVTVLCLDDLRFTHASPVATAGKQKAERVSDPLAYLIYTSGSTGKPKGVMVSHRNVVNFFAAMDQVLGFDRWQSTTLREAPVWLAVTSMCFDISVLELLWTLTRGFTVVIRRESDPPISEQILSCRITHLQCTPSLAGSLVRERFAAPALRQVETFLVGGEALPSTLAALLRDMLRGELINLYGPTETTVWSAAYRIESLEKTVPIGTPIANTQIRILNEILEPVEIGQSGEIFIGGEGVASGYFNRPELTAEKFVFVNESRLYRTGDIGRLRTDRISRSLRSAGKTARSSHRTG